MVGYCYEKADIDMLIEAITVLTKKRSVIKQVS